MRFRQRDIVAKFVAAKRGCGALLTPPGLLAQG
jgi:hypothetical protein